MENHLILGINPFTISRITVRKARRYGLHPLKRAYLEKKHPIRDMLGFYADPFAWWESAEVCIIGSQDLITRIQCKSNQQAMDLRDQLNEQLNQFLTSIKSCKCIGDFK
jgi:hypothetical protein